MKNIIKLSFLALATAFLSISCLDTSKYEGNDPSSADGAEIVTIVDGSYDTNYYVVFDSGMKAYVTENKVAQSITFPTTPEQMKGEVRKLIYFNYENTTREGYDLCISIVGMADVETHLLKNIDAEDIADKIETHTSPVRIEQSAFSKVSNYITLRINILRSDQDNFKHSIILTHNKSRKGAFENVYNSTTDIDSYLWLELYHDSDTDYEEYIDEIYTSHKIDPEYLELGDIDIRSKYKGIKILYKDISSKKTDTHTIMF